jgi:hypothetical protein
MDGRSITLTPGATLHFGSLGFVYTGPAESVAGRTFARAPHPNVLARPAETNRWAGGSSWSGTQRCTPVDNPASRTTR